MSIRRLKGKDLPNYDMSSVFEDLYRIEEMIKSDKYIEQRNYITIRLVTIIEQFFRKVMEFLLRRYPERRPPEIALDTRIIVDIAKVGIKHRWLHVTELIISQTFSFQNTKAIAHAMTEYGKIEIFSNSQKQANRGAKECLMRRDYDKLFDARHSVIHSIEGRPYLDAKKYYDMTENLLNHTLEQVGYYRFYEECDQVLVKLHKSKTYEYHQSATKLYSKIEKKHKLAGELFHSGSYKKAITHYDEVLFLEPDDFLAHFSKGCALLLLEEYREAIESFERHLEVVDDPGVYIYLGMALQKLKEYEDAIKCFSKAIQHEPNKVPACISMAVSLGSIGLLDDVLTYIDMILAIEPDNTTALHIKTITQDEIKRLNGKSSNAT